jgi:Secretion system C-terminal sorting domain
MKTSKPILLLYLLVLQLTLSAQVQWYQNQDANNPLPSATVATSIKQFTSNTFIACYLWSIDNEQNTWKISKSNINGTEIKTFFATGIYANVEIKVGRNNCIYVFERSFTSEYSPQYKIYKLDANLNVVAQRNIELPGGFIIYSVNAFELDDLSNVYFAGDGQYPNLNGGVSPASFVLKTTKQLVNSWSRMDSSETSFTRLLIDRWGRVLVTEDYYTLFPIVRIKRFAFNGQSLSTFIINTDAGRYTVNTALDNDDNILMYGCKIVNQTSRAMYLKRISRFSGTVVYSKTHFIAAELQLNDFKTDHSGNIYTLVTQSEGPDNQQCKISRINLSNGTIAWNRTMNFAQDSCNLTRLVINENDRFYAVGEKKSSIYFSKGFAVRIKKNGGQLDGNFPAPDSVAFQRSHWLADGFADYNNRLIAIGCTTDLDTTTYNSSYFRSFALQFGTSNCYGKGGEEVEEVTKTEVEKEETDKVELTAQLIIYPNPVQNQLTVSNINSEEYNRVVVYNMQGAQLKQQTVSTSMARFDISDLPDGVYLLILRSTGSLKEKSIKFVVRK